MPTHAQKRVVPYAPAQMFELVAGVERYPDFLPWCAGARIRGRVGVEGREEITADLIISYKVFREQFTSRVLLDPARLAIDVEYLEGPFRYLNNHWRFLDLGEGAAEIDFFVDFAFRSRTLQKAVSGVFDRAVTKLINAFEVRAKEVYGPAPSVHRSGQEGPSGAGPLLPPA